MVIKEDVEEPDILTIKFFLGLFYGVCPFIVIMENNVFFLVTKIRGFPGYAFVYPIMLLEINVCSDGLSVFHLLLIIENTFHLLPDTKQGHLLMETLF